MFFFFFSSRRRHTRCGRDWSSDVCSSDLLAGIVQPLSGEYAGRREVLEQVRFSSGYGVELGLLIDIASRCGLDGIAQVDLEVRVHRNQDMQALSRMSFGILQTALTRLEEEGRMSTDSYSTTLYQFSNGLRDYEMQPQQIVTLG